MSPLSKIINELKSGNSPVALSARGSFPERVAIAIHTKTKKRIVMIFPSTTRAKEGWMNLSHLDFIFTGSPVTESELNSPHTSSRRLLITSSAHSRYSNVAGEFAEEMSAMAVMAKVAASVPWSYLVVDAGALLPKFPSKNEIKSGSITIFEGDQIDPHEVARRVAESGYQKFDVVQSPGTFALRGGIVDLYPPTSPLPVRLQWGFEGIEQIKTFDPETQRSTGSLQHLFIPPCSPIFGTEKKFTQAVEKLKKLLIENDSSLSTIQELSETIISRRPGRYHIISRYLNLLHKNLESIISSIPDDCILILVDPHHIFNNIDKIFEGINQDYLSLRDNTTWAPPPQQLYADCEEIKKRMSKLQRVGLITTSIPSSIPDWIEHSRPISLNVEDLKSFTTFPDPSLKLDSSPSPGTLAEKLKQFQKMGGKLIWGVLTETGGRRIEELFGRYGIDVSRVHSSGSARSGGIFTGPARSGYIFTEGGEIFLTEEEVFGRKTRRPVRFKRVEDYLSGLENLVIHDHIVHKVHGIGIYRGLVKRKHDECIVEMLKIEYRGGDILYLPVYHLNQVQKFTGGRPARLDRLGGDTFKITKEKSRKNAYWLADRLLQLYGTRQMVKRKPYPQPETDYYEFESLFPYEETDDQIKAIDQINQDLSEPNPMDRLLCGDVGFGKTEVAARAAYRVISSGKQVAILVPTTVLAQQHYFTFRERFRNFPVKIEMLSRFQTKKKKAQIIRELKEGKVDMVIGTHRMLSGDVHFKNLALLIIDEEHRFGVAHKERIKFLTPAVDVLTMTATPIPRTLQMALGNMLKLSIITTPPPHRLPIKTFITGWNEKIISSAIEREIERGGKVFFLHNRIASIPLVHEKLKNICPRAKIAIAHGRMNSAQLEKVMIEFAGGKIDILLTTSIIESGLDIPIANTIIINDAHRFGLAQLYQIRGRIGRSSLQAYAYLIIPHSQFFKHETMKRMDALMKVSLGGGFSLAAADLEIRGAGELLGKRQSGHIQRVGFELYAEMLKEAIATLTGKPYAPPIEPEIKIAIAAYIPENYIQQTGIRFSFYKRLASASNEEQLWRIIEEMEDRFGTAPQEVKNLRKVMTVKTLLRKLSCHGIEAGERSVSVHLSDRTPIPPEEIVSIARSQVSINKLKGKIKITPEMKVTFSTREKTDPMELAIAFVELLLKHLKPQPQNPMLTSGPTCNKPAVV